MLNTMDKVTDTNVRRYQEQAVATDPADWFRTSSLWDATGESLRLERNNGTDTKVN